MLEDKGILIKNIFYMLSYSFQILKRGQYREVANEEFSNIEDLLPRSSSKVSEFRLGKVCIASMSQA